MKQKFLHSIFFLITVCIYGQVNIDLVTDKKEYTTRDLVIVTIAVELTGQDFNREGPLILPDFSKFDDRGSTSQSNTFVDPETNTLVTQMLYIAQLQPKKAGKFKIGSAIIRVNGKAYKTEPFDINVEEAGDPIVHTPQNDVFINWEMREKEVFAYQPTVATLKAYSKNFNSLRRIGEIILPIQSNIDFKPISTSRSDIELNQRTHMLSQILGIYLLFPKESGNLKINPVLVKMKDHHTKSDRIKPQKSQLYVKKLPDEAPFNFDNAVGNFQVEVSTLAKNTQAELNKPMEIVVKLNGHGNLSEDQLPVLKQTGNYKVFPPKIIKNIKSNDSGMVGSIEAHYVVIPKKAGNMTIQAEDFAFFNPKEKKYVNLGQKSLPVKVMTAEQIEASKSTLDKVNEYTNTVLSNVPIAIVKDDEASKNSEATNVMGFLGKHLATISFAAGLLVVSLLFIRRMRSEDVRTPKAKTRSESISELEERLRTNQKIDFSPRLDFMTKQLESGNAVAYFESFDELKKELNRFASSQQKADWRTYLKESHSDTVMMNYQAVVEKIQMERYAPAPSLELLEDLHKKLVLILSEIS